MAKVADKIDRLVSMEITKAEKEADKEAKEADLIVRLAVKEISLAEKEQAKADKDANIIVRLAVQEITKAEKELKKNIAVRKAWEEMSQRMAIDAPGAVFSQQALIVE